MKGKIKNVEPFRTKLEIQNMREALKRTNYPERNLLMFDIGLNTGLRIGDILRLRKEDVRGKTSIVIQEGKTKKRRVVYLDALMVSIANYVGDDGDGYLFESRMLGKPISTTQAYRILRAAGEANGYDHVGSHSMRKSYGFWYYKQTKDIATLMMIFNHDNQSITKRYIGINDDEIKNSLKGFIL